MVRSEFLAYSRRHWRSQNEGEARYLLGKQGMDEKL